ncbi:MAG: fatty acid--CoA ligase family protein [Prevotellaceae bacterium]|nr:fatty acid--CoA ligase family protein [Prevotellaceae bacterium]MCD8304803.1 fatty acid--CoA ligase family protein [Prevotellaceae bacterium]
MRIEDCIARHSEEEPHRAVVIDAEGSHTYADLYVDIQQCTRELSSGGVSVLPLRATPTYEFIVRYLASHVAGRVAVPLGKDLPKEQFLSCVQRLSRGSFPEGTADVLFTTGTTGRPKGVMLSHEALMANAENLIEAQGYCPGLTFIVTGPLSHIGSLSKVHASLAAGATVRLLDGLRDMNAFFDCIERSPQRVATFQVPSSLRMLLSLGSGRLKANAGKISFIETGAAPMAESDMRRLCELLPGTRLYNTYASTEAGIISTYDYNSLPLLPACLGKPMRHSGFSVTAEGAVLCTGSTLMTGYWQDEALTREVLKGGTLLTSDLGCVDEEGRLRLVGREGNVVNVGGLKVAPEEVEEAMASVTGIADCVCLGVRHPLMGQALKLLLVAGEGDRPTPAEIARQLRTRLEAYKVPQLYEYVSHIERTPNGKINRSAYKS